MEQYRLEPSLVVPTNENTVPKNGLKVSFVSGVLAGEDFSVSRLNSLWALFGLAAKESETMLVAIEYDLFGFSLLIAKQGERFCVFIDEGDGSIDLIGTHEKVATGFFPVIDPRWGLVYFIPSAVLLGFPDLVKLVNPVVNSRSIGEFTRCPQNGEEIMSIYRKLQDAGLVE